MPIYVGTQKIDMSGIEKVYVGTQLVYQKSAPIVLESITLSGQTTSLNRGASFSFGGTVTAHYSNGSTANVTSSTTFSGYNMNLGGTYTVTASYTENGVTKTATYKLTVNKVWSTLWTGSKTVSVSQWTDSANAYVNGAGNVCTGNKSGTPQFRVTFTHSYQTNTSYLKTRKYYWGGSSQTATTSIGSSPKTITISGWGTDIIYITADKANTYSSGNGQLRLSINTNASTGKIGLWGGYANITKGNGSSVQCYINLTVTKIEQYY